MFNLVVLGRLIHFQIRRVVDGFFDGQVHQEMIQLVLSDEDRFDLFVLNEQLAVVLDVGRSEQALEERGLSGSRWTFGRGSRTKLVSVLIGHR